MQKVLGCRILKKKHTIVRFISEDSGDFVTGSQKGNYLSWSWLSPFSNPNHSFKPTYSRQNSCPSPLKKCSRELRYRGNRIFFFFFFCCKTYHFICTIMKQHTLVGLGGESNILPPSIVLGLWVNKWLSIRVLKYLLTLIIVIRGPTEFYLENSKKFNSTVQERAINSFKLDHFC